MEVMEHLFQLNAIGLVYDGVGVAILGFAFFSKSLDALLKESNAYYGGNAHLQKSLIQSQVDGITGTIFLFLGFILQFLGSVGVRCDLAGQILVVCLIVAAICYFPFLRPKISERRCKKANELRKLKESP